MNRPLTPTALTEEHRHFADGRGVSTNCASMRYLPAFRDTVSGETHLSLLPNGSVSPVHLLDGLPEHWILERDFRQRVTLVRSSIIAGFLRNGKFYTRDQLARLPIDA